MKPKCLFESILILAICLVLQILIGCNGGSSSSSDDPPEPEFDQATFTNPTQIDNTYLPLIPGTTQVYQAKTEDGVENLEFFGTGDDGVQIFRTECGPH
jgi:hypothetical protein